MAAETMITLEEAYRRLDAALSGRRLDTESLPVREALGRVLALAQTSQLDMPPFDKAAVDGYALFAGDRRDEYELVTTIAAGHPGGERLEPGKAIKVMTGAPVPAGAERVVMLEDADEHDGIMRVVRHSNATNICPRAEDVRAGQEILRAGQQLGPVALANLIACGITEVEVARPIKVAIISTGDELADDPRLLKPGQIMNSNGPLLSCLARQHGLVVVRETSIGDEREQTAAVLAEASRDAELIVLSGGVSAGDFDFVPQVMRDLGFTLHFDRVAIKPGKPTTFATNDTALLFGLPGNPVAVFLTFHLFVLRAVAHLTGAKPGLRSFAVHLAAAVKQRSAERTAFIPCRLRANGEIEPLEYHGSAHLAALVQTDGFCAVPRGVESLPAGDEADFYPLDLGGGDAG